MSTATFSHFVCFPTVSLFVHRYFFFVAQHLPTFHPLISPCLLSSSLLSLLSVSLWERGCGIAEVGVERGHRRVFCLVLFFYQYVIVRVVPSPWIHTHTYMRPQIQTREHTHTHILDVKHTSDANNWQSSSEASPTEHNSHGKLC